MIKHCQQKVPTVPADGTKGKQHQNSATGNTKYEKHFSCHLFFSDIVVIHQDKLEDAVQKFLLEPLHVSP
jgi:hypothetical protein